MLGLEDATWLGHWDLGCSGACWYFCGMWRVFLRF
jgi:hypothetical protein